MAAKVKKVKEEKKEDVAQVENESEEAVIEVKTTKIPTEGISSFSQLDAEKKLVENEGEEKNEDNEEETDKQESEVDDEAETTSEVSKTEEETIETPELKQDTKTVESAASSDEAKKWLKSATPELETEAAGDKGSKAKIFIVIIAIAVILGIIAGGFYYYRSKVSSPQEPTKPSTTTETVVTPQPTEEPVTEEIEFSEFSVSILNGSGVPGEAGNAESLMSDLEFSSVDTGNAESYDYENTEVSLKDGLPEGIYTKIEEALTGEYNVTLSETTLDEDSSFDIIIIVGSKK